MLENPFFCSLEESTNILVAGAGGGYDIFCGLPLYFALEKSGKKVHLANLSFSFLPQAKNDRLSPSILEVNASTNQVNDYFPELYLSQWFKEKQEQYVPVHCFERTGVKPLLASYKALVSKHSIDTIILVDGGTDSLMRGNEDGLGTPQEDIASITAVNELEIERKMLVCLGFGVDHFHGVSNDLSLKAIADLTNAKGFLGMFSLLNDMLEVKKYREATEYVFEKMPDNISIVSSSILSALSGHYGNYQATSKTKSSKLWINPLMCAYLCFDLKAVADRILYLHEMKETISYDDIQRVIMNTTIKYRNTVKRRDSLPD
jgi:hypothetical protein